MGDLNQTFVERPNCRWRQLVWMPFSVFKSQCLLFTPCAVQQNIAHSLPHHLTQDDHCTGHQATTTHQPQPVLAAVCGRGPARVPTCDQSPDPACSRRPVSVIAVSSVISRTGPGRGWSLATGEITGKWLLARFRAPSVQCSGVRGAIGGATLAGVTRLCIHSTS